MIASAIPVPPVSKPWLAPRRCLRISGNYATVHQRFACIKPLRNALHQFAWQSTQQEAWAKDYYERKRREGKSHTMAIRALANVWVRIIFAMWSKQEAFQRTTFEAAQRLHAHRAA
jgi:hypothetical protein